MTITLVETIRLRLIVVNPQHAEFISNMYNRDSVKYWLGEGYGLDTPKNVLNRLIIPLGETYYKQFGLAMCVIQEKSSGKLIGINGVIKRPFLDAPNIGYALIPESWGKGYATESCQGLVNYCSDLGYKKIYAGNIDARNKRSINVCRKLGMKLEDPSFEWGQGGTIGQLYGMGLNECEKKNNSCSDSLIFSLSDQLLQLS